jgi:CMP/dCMP kinase
LSIPVITFDGVSGVGKGTAAHLLAARLKWNYMDSGAIYRALAVMATELSVDYNDENQLTKLVKALSLEYKLKPHGSGCSILLQGKEISDQIRTAQAGVAASKVSVHPLVRAEVNGVKRSFRKAPGLVTDGRDMGSVVFPDAVVKFYFDASPEERAKRRFKQLQASGIDVKLDGLLEELVVRDARDKQRNVAPLVIPEGAHVIDTSDLSIEKVMEQVDRIVDAAQVSEWH